MERPSLTNGISTDFLHPLSSPPHHVRRLSPVIPPSRPSSPSPSARRRRRQRKPWRKLLWVKQDYPDNWTDHSFLEELQRNGIDIPGIPLSFEYALFVCPLLQDLITLSQMVLWTVLISSQCQ